MTIRLRILALLSLLSLLCIGTTWYFKRLHSYEEVFARQQRTNALSSRLQRLVGATTRPVSRFVRDVSGRDGMGEFLAQRDPVWAAQNLAGMMEAGSFDAVWVLDGTGAVIYRQERSGGSAPGAPLLPDELGALLRKNLPFDFHELNGGQLYYFEGRPIGTAGSAPAGWLIVAQYWGEQVLNDLADLGQGRVALTTPGHVSDVRDETELEAWLPLSDHRGRTLAGLDYHVIDPLMENPAMEEIELTLFIYNGVGAVVLVAVLMHFLILRPFALVRASLVSRDSAPLAPLLDQRNEFGQMARLVQSSMRDREQLQQALEDRVRLGRELHDGVIQSVFGSGMALTRVQALMGRDPAAAQKLLDDTRAELNRIILDLRRHIDKADPKLVDSSFGAAVTQLIQQSQGSAPVAAELAIDEDLVAAHPLLHRSQALQFVREAVSNAVRHGHPRRLSVAWQRTAEGSTLTITDDGIGFDPKATNPGGRGLGNLGERAVSLGGRLEIDSSPNQGTRVCLTLPNPAKPA